MDFSTFLYSYYQFELQKVGWSIAKNDIYKKACKFEIKKTC